MTDRTRAWKPTRVEPNGGRKVLLTGASGVVGDGVLPRLASADLACLVHRSPIRYPGVESVVGDLTAPRLGLDQRTYSRLAREIETVVHCAAVTDFNRDDGSLEATNVGGTEQIVAFAEDAGAHLVHISTAYLHAEADGDRGRTAVRYAASKRVAEDLVRAARVPSAIMRPSIVIGDSQTGYIKAFQGLHLVAGAIMDGYVPVAPFDPTWPLDFVPNDVVADVIAAVVAEKVTGELWVTAGRDALSLGRAMGTAESLADELGVDVDPVRFVPPDVFDRLFAPVFFEALPRRVKYTFNKLLEFFAAYLAVEEPLPSDLGRLCALAGRPFPDLRESLMTSLRYWASATGRVAELTAVA
jgi:nucleoside-diphosphate-sugar epimerase